MGYTKKIQTHIEHENATAHFIFTSSELAFSTNDDMVTVCVFLVLEAECNERPVTTWV